MIMNIRGLGRTLDPLFHPAKEVSTEKVVKSSDSTSERDGNGQMFQGEDQHPPMSEEQFKKAIEHLKSLSIFKEHDLEAEVIDAQGKYFVLLKEKSGKIIRRIPEAELWSLIRIKDKEKGQLISKSA